MWDPPSLEGVKAHLAHSRSIAWGDGDVLLILSDPLLSENANGRYREGEGQADEVEDIDLDVADVGSEAADH